jgi:hypothetical protein
MNGVARSRQRSPSPFVTKLDAGNGVGMQELEDPTPVVAILQEGCFSGPLFSVSTWPRF